MSEQTKRTAALPLLSTRTWLSPAGSGRCIVMLSRPLTKAGIERYQRRLEAVARAAIVQEIVYREQKTWETYLEASERVSESLGTVVYEGMRFQDGSAARGAYFRELDDAGPDDAR